MEQRTAVQSDEAVSHFRVPNCFLYRGKRTQIAGRFLLDTSLSSSPFLANSSRHSLTSRIECNSRAFYHLIFSSRHLNATLQNRKTVEKFNTRVRFFAAWEAGISGAFAIEGEHLLGDGDATSPFVSKNDASVGTALRNLLERRVISLARQHLHVGTRHRHLNFAEDAIALDVGGIVAQHVL